MNVYDSGKISELLTQRGFSDTDVIDDADVIVLNTCHIREKASEKIYSELGLIGEAKERHRAGGRLQKVVVAGCVAQAEGAEIIRRQPAVDFVVGTQSYHLLPDLLGAPIGSGNSVRTDFATRAKFRTLEQLPVAAASPISAFLTIEEGCDKFCSFCVVPYTRGAQVCRAPADLVAEADRLVSSGAREITLLGQNVNAYGASDAEGHWDLARLVDRLAEQPGLFRIRYTTSHPRDVTPSLIEAHRRQPKLMPFLHLPIQSGSDKILHAMNRQHTADDFRRIIERFRIARPDMAFSTDIIVGFPGETDADFRATCALVTEIGFSSAYSFKYSSRPGTPAAKEPAQVEEAVKQSRLRELQALIDGQRRAMNELAVGQTMAVLFDKSGRHPGQIGGKSPFFHSVHLDGPVALVGAIADVTIFEAGPNSLAGRLVNPAIGSTGI